MPIVIVDYGVGNLFSLVSSFRKIGAEVIVTSDKETIANAEKIILPGVGAFGDAIAKLRATGLDKVIINAANKGTPLMGICLGMQLLFERSFEFGCYDGLGLIKGSVIQMENKIEKGLKIPHIGWNSLTFKQNSPLLKNTKEGDFVYFVHSFFVDGENESAVAVTDYGASITACVGQGNIMGCQFHPEKSGEVGLGILKAFCEIEVK